MTVPGVGDNSVHAVQFSILFNGLPLLLFLALFEAGREKVGKFGVRLEQHPPYVVTRLVVSAIE